jgi:hypothetical protein
MNEILLVAGLVAVVGGALTVLLVRGRDFASYGQAEHAEADKREPAAAAA